MLMERGTVEVLTALSRAVGATTEPAACWRGAPNRGFRLWRGLVTGS
jgi:hypothetical protein